MMKMKTYPCQSRHTYLALLVFAAVIVYGHAQFTGDITMDDDGLVIVYDQGKWATICASDDFTFQSQVLCRSFGQQFSYYSSHKSYLQGSIRGLECRGDENSLSACSDYYTYSYGCYYDTIHVQCQEDSTKSFCPFDNDICGMDSEGTEDYKWQRFHPYKSSGLSQSVPRNDHTTESNKGKYMLASAVSFPGQKANLKTKPFVGNMRSVSFYYHMFGRDMGSLNVYIKTNNSSRKSIGSISGNQGIGWKYLCLSVDEGYGHHEIIFEAVHGKGFDGDIAIDDMTISETDCSSRWNGSCDFENSTCGYDIQNWYSMSRGWRLRMNNTMSIYYSSETYLAFRSSYSKFSHSVASPTIDTPKEKSKVEFQYYMPGTETKELQVKFVEGGSTSWFTKTPYFWQDNEDHGSKWQYGCMELPTSKRGEIKFTGIANRYSTIGLDDIVVDKGFCRTGITNYMCTFDNPLLCEYEISCMNPKEYIWKRKKGATSSYYTGPDGDYSKQNGYYMYAEASYGDVNDTTSLKFPISNNTKGKYLTFAYHMYGYSVGQLSVIFKTKKMSIEGSTNEEIVWTRKGNQGNNWHKSCLFIEKDVNEIIFVAVKGSSYQGDIAVDNILIDENGCPGPFDCDFQERTLCNYKISSYNFRWYFGTEYSYNSYSNRYFYMYSNTNTENVKFEMYSPQAAVKGNSSVTFKYKLTGNMKDISLINYDSYSRNISWSSNYNDIHEFITACVDFPFSTEFGLIFQATTQSNSRWDSYLYLDDIKTRNETCKLGLTYYFCKFKEVHLCNFHVECPENTKYNWSRGSSSDYRGFPRPQRYSYEQEYYMYVDSLKGKPGDKTHLSFSNVAPAAGHSLRFDYYHQQGSGILQVDLETANGRKRVFEEFSVVSSSVWQSACVSVPNEYVDIEFIATNVNGMGQYMGLTNVGFLPGECQARSISCDFSEGTCQYSNLNYYSTWTRTTSKNDISLTNGFYMETSPSYYYGESMLASPTENITNSCVQIRYKIINKNCNLTIFNAFNNVTILSTVSEDNTTQWSIAQKHIQQEAVKLVFLAKVTGYLEMCKVLIDYINITENDCTQLKCPAGTRKCKNNYCYSESKLCDRINDCSDGTDEMNCSSSISCEFSTKYYCGYKVVNGWQLVLDNSTTDINAPGSMQIIGRKGKMLSPFETLADSCVNIKFTTDSGLTGNFSVFSNHLNPDGTFSHDLAWNEYFYNEIDGNYEGQFQFSAGKGFLTFMADIKSGGLALDSVTVLNGTCPELNCSPNTYKCLDNTKCINKKNLCNNYWNCKNGGDEANCPKYFTCNFEDSNMCGFRSSPEKQWSIGTGMRASIPSLDHSEGTYEGQYLVSNSSGESKLSLPGITTEETFCFNFHYMFSGNGTVSIYDNDTFLMSLSKFDNDMWRGVNITLPSGSHNIHFVYSNGNSTNGKMALDSVSIIRGRCSHKSCETNWYPCNNNVTCYPSLAKCDGRKNCPNGEDEDNCSGKLRKYKLTEGRTLMSGRVEMRNGSQYLPICSYHLQSKTLNDICYELGANATTTQTFIEITIIGNYYYCYSSYNDTERCYLRDCNDGCSCYATYVTCSNTTCEDGMVRCHPGRNETNSSDVCIKERSMCNGEIDCKDGTDEISCASCAVGHWRCKNWNCIKQGLRCDGKKDCDDGSDEFRCFTYVNKTIQVYYNGSYKNICENNLNDKDIPNQLCSSVGRSNGTFGNSIDGVGVQFIKKPSGSDTGLIPGFKANSFGQCKYMVLECSEQVCGTRRRDLFEPNIQNGHNAVQGEWPWVVQLYFRNIFMCTASIISKYYVLTAAHCADDPNLILSVKVGSVERKGGTFYNVTQAFIHERYGYFVKGYDLALLYVESGITMTDDVQPICLPENPAPLERDYYATGWGRNEHDELVSTLAEAQVSILDYHYCKSYYPPITRAVICGNNKDFYSPICFGDSGGPLQTLNEKGFWEVHGVASFVSWNCQGTVSHPGAYSSVYHGIEWIRKYL